MEDAVGVTRRQLVALGAAGAAGAVVGKVATWESPAAAAVPPGGIHIYCLLKGVHPAPLNGFPYSVMFTVWGTDEALHGMGWGATLEGGDSVQSYAGSSLLPCVFAVHGSVEGDAVELSAVQIFSGARADQGLPWWVDANLATGAVRGVEVNAEMGTEVILEGTGVVTRI